MARSIIRYRDHGRSGETAGRRASRHRWAPLAAGAMIALALAGCGRVATSTSTGPGASSGTSTPTTTPTPTPLQLTWQAATTPAGGQAQTYAPAPSNGQITYACGITSSSAKMWVTRDRGASWSGPVTLPYSGPISRCTLAVDANNPQVLAAAIDTYTGPQGASPQLSMFVPLFSHDGGATWQSLPRIGPHIMRSLVSSGSSIYAAGDGIDPSGQEAQGVWVSHDNGHTWTSRDAADLQPNPSVWVNPQTGDLIGTSITGTTIYHSTDGGATWTQIAVPNVVPLVESFLAAPNGTGWRICETGQTSIGPQEQNVLTCTSDLGANWTRPPALNLTFTNAKGTFTGAVDVYAITDSGALLAWYTDVSANIQLAALAPGASAWTPINATEADGTPVNVDTASATLTYATGPGDGMLWVNYGPTAPFLSAMYP